MTMSNNNQSLFHICLRSFFVFVLSIWYFLIPRVFAFKNYFKRKRVCPPVKDDDEILLNSAVELANQIRAGEITSEELVQACIKRMSEINGLLNAVVETNFENALSEARRIDRSLADESAPSQTECPLLGVPFTIKDSIPISGMLCTAGIPARRNIRVYEDAGCVRLLKSAGAIPLAVTNVSEVTMWWETNNGIYGRSNNPYDIRRTVGGSSGGEAALQAAAGSVLSIGSDIGGSVRIPAFFNGIFGHKPTGGIVTIDGMIPSITGGFKTCMLTVGPMCRYAEDLSPLLRVLAAENAQKLRLDEPVDFQTIRIFYMNRIDSVLTMQPDSEITDAMDRAMKYFEMRYNTVIYRLDLSLVHWTIQIWTEAMMGGGEKAFSFSQEMCNRAGDLNMVLELTKWAIGRSKHTFPALGLAVMEKAIRFYYGGGGGGGATRKDDEEYGRLLQHLRRKLTRQLEELLGPNGVLFFPPHPTAAPFHNQPIFTPNNFAYTALFNSLALPVTQCPLLFCNSTIIL